MRRIQPAKVRSAARPGVLKVRGCVGIAVNAAIFARLLGRKWSCRRERFLAALTLLPAGRLRSPRRGFAQTARPASSPVYLLLNARIEVSPVRERSSLPRAVRSVDAGSPSRRVEKRPRAASAGIVIRAAAGLSERLIRIAPLAAGTSRPTISRQPPAADASRQGRHHRSVRQVRPEGAPQFRWLINVRRLAEGHRSGMAKPGPAVPRSSGMPAARPAGLSASRAAATAVAGLLRWSRPALHLLPPAQRAARTLPSLQRSPVEARSVAAAPPSRRVKSRKFSPPAKRRQHAAALPIEVPLAGRRRRAEHAPLPPAFAIRPRALSGPERAPSRAFSAALVATPARRQTSTRADPAMLTAAEQALTEKLQKRIDHQVAVTIREKLALEADYPSIIAERIQSTLHDRLVLEKERLG